MRAYGIRRNDVSACCPFCRDNTRSHGKRRTASGRKARHAIKARARRNAKREIEAEA